MKQLEYSRSTAGLTSYIKCFIIHLIINKLATRLGHFETQMYTPFWKNVNRIGKSALFTTKLKFNYFSSIFQKETFARPSQWPLMVDKD